MAAYEMMKEYQIAFEFFSGCSNLVDRLPSSYFEIGDHLIRGSMDITLSVAESSLADDEDRQRVLGCAKQSVSVCGSCLDLFMSQGILELEEGGRLRELLRRVSKMLTSMMRGEALASGTPRDSPVQQAVRA